MARSLATPIRLPESFRRSLGVIAENADKLPMLSDAVARLEPSKQTPPLVAAAFAQLSGISLANSNEIVKQIMGLHALRMDLSLSPAETFQAITENLESEATEEWKATYLEKWKSARLIIERAIDPSHPLSTIYKSIQLLYDHQNIVHSATVITDLRPVFDESRREIQRMLITHVLEIEYSDGRQRRKFFAALDANDIVNLKKACERAETKAVALAEALKIAQWPVVNSGAYSD